MDQATQAVDDREIAAEVDRRYDSFIASIANELAAKKKREVEEAAAEAHRAKLTEQLKRAEADAATATWLKSIESELVSLVVMQRQLRRTVARIYEQTTRQSDAAAAAERVAMQLGRPTTATPHTLADAQMISAALLYEHKEDFGELEDWLSDPIPPAWGTPEREAWDAAVELAKTIEVTK